MLSVKIIAPGTLKEPYLREAFAEYKKRLGALSLFEEIVIKESPLSRSPGQEETEAALAKEARLILAKMPHRAYKIALCIEGEGFSSEALAEKIDALSSLHSEICFVIGSSHGLHPSVKNACDLRMSVSGFTFPHQLMRVMLAEIIYRSLSINKGGKYHK